jgi:hypothetical protein
MNISAVRIFGLVTEHRGERLLARLDRSLAEARELCNRAHDANTDDPDGAIADAFLTILAQPTREWLRRAELLTATIRTGGGGICFARAEELRVLIDRAHSGFMRQPTGRKAWSEFYRTVQALENAAPGPFHLT